MENRSRDLGTRLAVDRLQAEPHAAALLAVGLGWPDREVGPHGQEWV